MPRIAVEKSQDELPGNVEVAARLKVFRELFVHKNQSEAADLLKISQGWLSQMERGHRPIPFKVIDVLNKEYRLNGQWLSTGTGQKQRKQGKPSKTDSGMTQLLEELSTLQSYIGSLEATMNATLNLVKKQDERIAKLEEKLMN